MDLDARLAGARLVELPASLRRRGVTGVLVEQVERGSRAARNNLRQGDVILGASTGDFTDLGGFRATLAEPPQQLILRIWRNGTQGNLPMR